MIYVCENNLWAAQTPASKTLALPDVAARAAGYGIPGVVVDGNDVVAVHEAAVEAVARARAGDGPSLIECKSYRWRRHTERPETPDRRPEHEIEHWKSQDPIVRLRAELQSRQGQLSAEEWEAMDREILDAIEASVTFAKNSPFPKPEAALEDVFAGEDGLHA
jgi:pyruvate dehydrogenase E1 component alpha subunit